MPDLGTIAAPECLHDQHRLAMAQLRDLFGPVSYIVDAARVADLVTELRETRRIQ
jgi:hypothetical protein